MRACVRACVHEYVRVRACERRKCRENGKAVRVRARFGRDFHPHKKKVGKRNLVDCCNFYCQHPLLDFPIPGPLRVCKGERKRLREGEKKEG